MSKNIFITATGTDVGKTYVSALIVKEMRKAGYNCGYFKPVLSGIEEQNGKLIVSDANYVVDTAKIPCEADNCVGYWWKEAVSPHLAAKRAGKDIEIEKIKQKFEELSKDYDYLLIEGAGGITCPLRLENGEKYLFWGSFRGIYYIELSEDGLHIRPGAKPTQIAGTAYEAVYVHKKGKYYYLFASIGSCCQGEKSTYTTVVGRSESLFGPYMDKNGNSMLDNHHEVVIHPNASFAGTGHNAEIMTDKKGDDWILYHAYIRDKAKQGRVVMLDRIHWKKGWPYVEGNMPSNEAQAPKF